MDTVHFLKSPAIGINTKLILDPARDTITQRGACENEKTEVFCFKHTN